MSHFSRRLAALALVGALAAISFAPGATAAGGKGCPDGAYCLWKQPGYEGKKLVVETNKLFNFPKFMNNKSSSFKSRVGDSRSVVLYVGKNGNGGGKCYDDGANDPAMGKGSKIFSSGDVFPLLCT